MATAVVAAWPRPAPARAPGRPVIAISERDFKITAPTRHAAGRVQLLVTNRGPDMHELIVVRQGRGPLPLRADGLTVDEDAVKPETAGTLEPGEPGARRRLDLRLEPGRYILLCNMAGHYLGGMHATIVVR